MMRTPYQLEAALETPINARGSRNCRKRLRLAMRDSADSVVQIQTASTIIRHKRAVWKSTLRVHHSAHAVFELRVAVTGPFVLCLILFALLQSPASPESPPVPASKSRRPQLASDTANKPPSQSASNPPATRRPARPGSRGLTLPQACPSPSPNPVQREAFVG
jgi:hypothetical protein